jgi:hypothetical protein
VKQLALLCLMLAAASSQAQTVYRCGSDGRLYSQVPCAEGRAVDVGDKRSSEQRAAAEARARDDQALGDALERERRDRESEQPVGAAKIDGRPTPAEPLAPQIKTSKKKNKGKQDQSEDFKAVAPSTQARRASL